jgi:hypothetical protein
MFFHAKSGEQKLRENNFHLRELSESRRERRRQKSVFEQILGKAIRISQRLIAIPRGILNLPNFIDKHPFQYTLFSLFLPPTQGHWCQELAAAREASSGFESKQ